MSPKVDKNVIKRNNILYSQADFISVESIGSNPVFAEDPCDLLCEVQPKYCLSDCDTFAFTSKNQTFGPLYPPPPKKKETAIAVQADKRPKCNFTNAEHDLQQQEIVFCLSFSCFRTKKKLRHHQRSQHKLFKTPPPPKRAGFKHN